LAGENRCKQKHANWVGRRSPIKSDVSIACRERPSSSSPIMSLDQLEEQINIQNEAIEAQPTSSSPTMSFDMLKECTHIQNNAIAKLPSDAFSPEPSDDKASWEGFRKEFWGKGLTFLEKQESVDRGSDLVADDDLPEKPPSGTFPVMEVPKSLPITMGLSSTKIMVRSEYNEAEQAALLFIKLGVEVFVVSGTPGIGIIPLLSIDCR